MPNILIISPHFPPVNAADMHRVRQSLPYFKELGWQPTVVMVKPEWVETSQDPLLMQTVPDDVEVIQIDAFSTRFTRKIGLGSLALRSMWSYFRTVNQLLRTRNIDLVYFSTTMFPLPVLGRVWKALFKVPYVVDIQDPWHSDYYISKPKHERPPKYWFSYRLNKYTEPLAMRKADGVVAVSAAYIHTMQERYPQQIHSENCRTLTFGAFEKDFDVLETGQVPNRFFQADDGLIHIPYIGRAGHDMRFSLRCIFHALQIGLAKEPAKFAKVRLYYIGTSYAAAGKGQPTVQPIAEEMGVGKQVQEITDRIPYFEALRLLKDARMLLIPGSDDPKYTASKLYNYILAKKPLIAVFHKQSSVLQVLEETRAGHGIGFEQADRVEAIGQQVYQQWAAWLEEGHADAQTDWQKFEPYTAREMARQQAELFTEVLARQQKATPAHAPS